MIYIYLISKVQLLSYYFEHNFFLFSDRNGLKIGQFDSDNSRHDLLTELKRVSQAFFADQRAHKYYSQN